MSEQLTISANDLEPTNREDAQAAFDKLWVPESEYFDPARSMAESLCQDALADCEYILDIPRLRAAALKLMWIRYGRPGESLPQGLRLHQHIEENFSGYPTSLPKAKEFVVVDTEQPSLSQPADTDVTRLSNYLYKYSHHSPIGTLKAALNTYRTENKAGIQDGLRDLIRSTPTYAFMASFRDVSSDDDRPLNDYEKQIRLAQEEAFLRKKYALLPTDNIPRYSLIGQRLARTSIHLDDERILDEDDTILDAKTKAQNAIIAAAEEMDLSDMAAYFRACASDDYDAQDVIRRSKREPSLVEQFNFASELYKKLNPQDSLASSIEHKMFVHFVRWTIHDRADFDDILRASVRISHSLLYREYLLEESYYGEPDLSVSELMFMRGVIARSTTGGHEIRRGSGGKYFASDRYGEVTSGIYGGSYVVEQPEDHDEGSKQAAIAKIWRSPELIDKVDVRLIKLSKSQQKLPNYDGQSVDMIVELGHNSGAVMMKIPGYDTVARQQREGRFFFVKAAHDPYEKPSVNLGYDQIDVLVRKYQALGADELVSSLLSQIDSDDDISLDHYVELLRQSSDYTYDKEYDKEHGNRGISVRNGRLQMQCSGAGVLLAEDLALIMPNFVTNQQSGYLLTSSARVAAIAHRQVSVNINGKDYYYDATPSGGLNSLHLDGDDSDIDIMQAALKDIGCETTKTNRDLHIESPYIADPEPLTREQLRKKLIEGFELQAATILDAPNASVMVERAAQLSEVDPLRRAVRIALKAKRGELDEFEATLASEYAQVYPIDEEFLKQSRYPVHSKSNLQVINSFLSQFIKTLGD